MRKPPRRFDEAPGGNGAHDRRKLILKLGQLGADMRVMEGAPDAALAEFCRVLQDLRSQVLDAREQLRKAGGGPAGPDLSPDQKAQAAGKFYDAHAAELGRLGVKREHFVE